MLGKELEMNSSNSAFLFQDLNVSAETPPNFNFLTPKPEPVDEPAPPLNFSPTAQALDAVDMYSEFNRISELFRTALAQHHKDSGDASTPTPPVPDPDLLALVPIPDPETQVSVAVAPPTTRKNQSRSSEMVRVLDLGSQDHGYFRDNIRKTRTLFDSLRIFAIAEEEKMHRAAGGPYRKPRGDLKATGLMRQTGLWLNRDKRIVGEIPGISIGDVFFTRMELCMVGLHGHPQAGIDYVPASQSSNGEPIATSIIVSGGYEDDEDSSNMIVYTGHGGQDKHNKQAMHQKLECGNLALERSMNYSVEVRVIRGVRFGGTSVGKIYVYDGLYRIIETWFDIGKSGFGVYKFRLVRIENQIEMGSVVMKLADRIRTQPLEARPKGYVSLDVSRKKENFPVFFFNDIDDDHDPIRYDYLVTTIFPQFVYNGGSNTGCECADGCVEDCLCARKNGGEFAYDMHGSLVRGKPLVFECGPYCRCSATCPNRVSQKGVRNRLEVFRSRETGWGVRSLDLIQAGSFICEYTGVVLTREQAQLFTMNGDRLIYPGRFGERWKEWGDLSQIFSDYVHPTYPSVPPLDFAMDVSRMRNVACYISHSTSPNVFVQLVLYDHNNVCFPHLMLFAMENIPPMRELSLDYGVAEVDETDTKLAICN